MKNISIRKALAEDKSALLTLEQKVVEAERPYNSTIKSEDARYYDLDRLIAEDSSYLIVAENTDTLSPEIIATGYAQIRESKKSLKHTKHSYLGFMYVEPEFRGLGINKLIMDKLITWSKEQGIFDLYLDVYNENDAAIRAYQKSGFAPSLVEMKINLDK